MEHFDLAQYCDFICGATLDETRTDKAEVIAYALETAGITDKTGLVMVGDREHDVLGAKKNGLPCIGAVYGYGTAEELTAAGAAAQMCIRDSPTRRTSWKWGRPTTLRGASAGR